MSATKSISEQLPGESNSLIRSRVRKAVRNIGADACGPRTEAAILRESAALGAYYQERIAAIGAAYRAERGESSPRCSCDACCFG